MSAAANPSRTLSYESVSANPSREASRRAVSASGSAARVSSDLSRVKGSSPRVAPASAHAPMNRSSSTTIAVAEEEGERWVEGRSGEAMRRAASDLGGAKAGGGGAAMAAALAGAVKAVPAPGGERGGETAVGGEERVQREVNAKELASEGGGVGGNPARVPGGDRQSASVRGGDSADGMGIGSAKSNGSGGSGSSGGGAGQQNATVCLSKPVREYSLDELMAATDQLARERQLGEGGFGVVFRGRLRVEGGREGREGEEGQARGAVMEVAVKVLKAGSEQGEKEWRVSDNT